MFHETVSLKLLMCDIDSEVFVVAGGDLHGFLEQIRVNSVVLEMQTFWNSDVILSLEMFPKVTRICETGGFFNCIL